MDLKSNRSGFWHHIIGTCYGLRWLCHKHSNNVIQHDKTPVESTISLHDNNILSRDMIKLQLSQHFCLFLSRDMSFMSHESDIMLWHAPSVWLLVQCCDIEQKFFAVVCYIIKHLFNGTAWSILFWNHKNDVTSLVKVHREYLPLACILHTKFD